MGQLTLDVGCGGDPLGDVNLDLYPEDRKQCAMEWNPRKVKNFVLGDVHHLPFRHKCFHTVYAKHVIEHLENPLEGLRELERVCSRLVWIWIPSEYSLDKTETHLYSWNLSSLKDLLLKVFITVEVGYTSRIRICTSLMKSRRYTSLVNLILSKLGIRPEIYARCWTSLREE